MSNHTVEHLENGLARLQSAAEGDENVSETKSAAAVLSYIASLENYQNLILEHSHNLNLALKTSGENPVPKVGRKYKGETSNFSGEACSQSFGAGFNTRCMLRKNHEGNHAGLVCDGNIVTWWEVV